MRISIIVLSPGFTCLLAQDASAAIKVKHFPRCPDGVVDKNTCECRAFVSSRFQVCREGQYCLRDAFHGMCW